jgi:2'-5' RNA ligase
MRLFIAADLGTAGRAAIAAEQQRIGRLLTDRDRSSVRWVSTEHIHLTLVFLGEVQDERADAVITHLMTPIPQAPFDVVFGRLGVFPPGGVPKVLWLGATEGGSALDQLHASLNGRVELAGVVVERRPFHPHLTLGRWRRARPRVARQILAADRHVDVARVRVDYVTLYQSRLTSAGPQYTALARATLT